MPRSMFFKLIICACFIAGVVLIGLLALPLIVDRWVLPPLLDKTPFSSAQASIFRLTHQELSGSIELEQHDKPLASIPHFRLRYTAGSLRSRSIDSLELSQAVFHLYRDQGRWLFPGTAGQPPPASGPQSSDRLLLLPFGVKALNFRQCRIVIHDGSGWELQVGLDGNLQTGFREIEQQRLLESIQGSLHLFDDVEADVTFKAAAADSEIKTTMELKNGGLFVRRDVLPDALKSLNFTVPAARLDLEMDRQGLALKHYRLDGRLAALGFSQGRIVIGDAHSGDEVAFALSGTGQDHTYRVSSLPLSAPIQTHVDIAGTATFRTGGMHAAGQLDTSLRLAGQADTGGSPLSLQFEGSWSKENGYRGEFSGEYRSTQPLALAGDVSISGPQKVQVSGTFDGHDDRTQVRLDVKSAPLTIARGTTRIETSAVDIQTSAVRIGDDYGVRMSGSLASAELPGHAIRLQDLNFSLPYTTASSLGNEFSKGIIKIGALLLNGEKLVSVAASLRQKDQIYRAGGSIDGLFNPNLHVAFDAEMSVPDGTGHAAWTLAPLHLAPEALPAQLGLPVDVDISGTLSASGTAAAGRSQITASLKTVLQNASIRLPDSDLSIDSINCTVEFPELPRLSSSPSQQCSTGSIDLASLHFDNADVRFRVEDSRTLFIEKSRLSWCSGRLDSGSIRLSPDSPEIETVLYCSRIRLGSLLEQLGLHGTEGEGSLNGTLPIRVSKRTLEFDKGFLFSTPGTGGIVRFTDTELLRQGMGDVGNTGYLGYSLAALEDFTYNWTKLTFDSSGENLLVTLELDGKPTTPLPYKFDKQGHIVESSQGNGLQYPIRLDVNFRLPLAELFRIGQSINSFMGNSK